MQDTIFTIELPLIKTDEELEKVKGLYPQYDPYFIVSGCILERRELFEKLWNKFKPYADKHFLSQIRTNFHQGSWEMYVGNVLLEKNLAIKSKDEGPDFVVDNNLYIECVAPTKGDPNKPDSVPERFITTKLEEISVEDVPVDQMILRITSAIKDKALNQYQNWKNKDWFDSKIPFVITVNTGDFGHVEDPGMPNVLKALFGFRFLQLNIKTGEKGYSYREGAEKTSNEYVPVNYFTNHKFSFVSGVLFSNYDVLNHPKNIGDDCIFVNNPFADNPVDEALVRLFKSWTASKGNDKISLKKNYG